MTELLNYAPSCPNDKIRYHKINVILHTHSDASYLSSPKSRIRAVGFHFLLFLPSDSLREKMNGAVYLFAKIFKNVLGSAAKTETGAAYENEKKKHH